MNYLVVATSVPPEQGVTGTWIDIKFHRGSQLLFTTAFAIREDDKESLASFIQAYDTRGADAQLAEIGTYNGVLRVEDSTFYGELADAIVDELRKL